MMTIHSDTMNDLIYFVGHSYLYSMVYLCVSLLSNHERQGHNARSVVFRQLLFNEEFDVFMVDATMKTSNSSLNKSKRKVY